MNDEVFTIEDSDPASGGNGGSGNPQVDWVDSPNPPKTLLRVDAPEFVPSEPRPDMSFLEHKTRETLAIRLLWFYGGFLLLSLFMVAIFVLTIIARKHTDPDVADVAPLATLASQGITALTGVVAGVIGFYFGSKSKE